MRIRLILVSLGIGALVAVAAVVVVDLLVDSAITVAVPQEDISHLSPAEVNERLRSGAIPLKTIHGLSKDVYLLENEPWVLARRWLYFFLSCSVAAYTSSVIAERRRAV